MQHPDEQILARFAMEADIDGPQRTMLEDHLLVCAGCRTQVEELRSINDLVAERSNRSPGPSPYSIEAIERTAHAARRVHAAPSRHTPRHMVTRLQRAGWLVHSHPIASGAAAMLFGIALFALVNVFPAQQSRTRQPAAIVLNPVSTAMLVVNESGETLFQFPLVPDRSPDADERDLKFNTRLFDIDGDGSVEVVTTAPYNEGTIERKNVIRVFDAGGGTIDTVVFGVPVMFRGSPYANSFTSLGLLIRTHAGITEFLVSINHFRSPSCLIRMTPDGTIIGEYWHFGWINNPTPVHVPGMDHDAVLLVGADDSHDLEGSVAASLVLLDPDLIIGRSESGATRGFGFPPSPAELMYVKTGHPDPTLLNTVMVQRTGFKPLVRSGDDATVTLCAKGLPDTPCYSLLYTFPRDFGTPTVYASDLDIHLLSTRFLAKKGPEAFRAFFHHMGSLVRYWDGQNWQPMPVRVRHPQPAS